MQGTGMKLVKTILAVACWLITRWAFAQEQQPNSNTKAAVKTQKYYAEIYGCSYDEPNVINKKSSMSFFGLGVQDFGQPKRSGLIYEARASYGETD